MDGPSAKVNLVLAEEPKVTGMPKGADANRRSLFTLVPSVEYAERCYDKAKLGEIPEDLWVDCVVASNVDPSLAPAGKHVMTCFVQYVPYRPKKGNWDEKREWLGDRVVEIRRPLREERPGERPRAPGTDTLSIWRGPTGSPRETSSTEILSLEQLFFMRPVPGWAQYRTPIDGLYLAGAGAHPGGGVTGAPGYNAAHRALKDFRRRPKR